MGTITAFAYTHRENKKNMCRGCQLIKSWGDHNEVHIWQIKNAKNLVRVHEEKRNLEEFTVNWKIILKYGA